MKKIIEVADIGYGCAKCICGTEYRHPKYDFILGHTCSASEEQQDYCFANDIHYEEVEE